MATAIRKLHQANVYLDAEEFVGIATEVTLPEVKPKTKEHAPTSMFGSIPLPYGLEPMTLTLKGDFDEAFVLATSDFYHQKYLQIRSLLTAWQDDQGRAIEKSVVAHLRVLFQGHKPDALKNGEPSEMEYTAAVTSYKLEVDGVPLLDINLMNNKHKVGEFVNLNDIGNALLGVG